MEWHSLKCYILQIGDFTIILQFIIHHNNYVRNLHESSINNKIISYRIQYIFIHIVAEIKCLFCKIMRHFSNVVNRIKRDRKPSCIFLWCDLLKEIFDFSAYISGYYYRAVSVWNEDQLFTISENCQQSSTCERFEAIVHFSTIYVYRIK